MFQKYKKIIIVVLVIVLAFILFVIIKGSGEEEGDGLLTSTVNNSVAGTQASGADTIGAEIITALNQIDSLKLETTIFEDPVFRQLIDKSQPLAEEPVGRENPFAPLESSGNFGEPELDFEPESSNATSTNS